MNFSLADYILIVVGIILLPVFGIGLIPFGILVWRIGQKWEKHNEQLEKDLRKYDIDYILPDKLEEMK